MRSTELEILGGYVYRPNNGYKMNLAHHMVGHFKSVAISRYTTRISFGGLITHLAMSTVGFVERNHVPVQVSTSLDSAYFSSLGQITSELQMDKHGFIFWTLRRERLFLLPET